MKWLQLASERFGAWKRRVSERFRRIFAISLLIGSGMLIGIGQIVQNQFVQTLCAECAKGAAGGALVGIAVYFLFRH